MATADAPDWTSPVYLFPTGSPLLTAADFPDWTDGLLVLTAPLPPPGDLPDWTKAVSEVAGITPPADLNGNLIAWYDATRLGPVDGTIVHTWPDLSGNGHDLTDASNAEVFVSNGINGRHAVNFTDPVQGVMQSAAITQHLPMTVAMVVQNGRSPDNGIMGVGGPFKFALAAGNWDFYGGTELTVAASNPTSPHDMVTVWHGDGTATMYIDGVGTSGNAGTGSGGFTFPVAVGRGPVPSGLQGAFLGLVGEVLLYNTDLTAGQATELHNYLEAKWLA